LADSGQTKNVIPLRGKKFMLINNQSWCETILTIAYNIINYLLFVCVCVGLWLIKKIFAALREKKND